MKFKKLPIFAIFFAISISLSADDFRWNLINALAKDDYQEVENIIKSNLNSLSETDKRMVMSFVLTYSRGDTTIQAVNMLSENGIFPNSYDLYTALNMNQSDAVINLILMHGVAPNGEILLLAMSRQRFEYARRFIDAGADVNYSYPLSRSYADGMTPLLFAARFNNFDLVKLLLEKGANINARSREGETALSLANVNGNTQIYNFLIERGASAFTPAPAPATATAPPAPASTPLPAQQSAGSGMASLLNTQVSFQTGTYRLSGGNLSIRFIGTSNAGSISYTINETPGNGVYIVNGKNLTVTMEGRSFIYNIDSNTSFSGNGEVWVRQ